MNGQYDVTVPSGDGVHAKGACRGRWRVRDRARPVAAAGFRRRQLRLAAARLRPGLEAAGRERGPPRRERRLFGSTSTKRRCWISRSPSAGCPGGWRRPRRRPSFRGMTSRLPSPPSRSPRATPMRGWESKAPGGTTATARSGSPRRVCSSTRLQAAFERPTRYGGVLDLDATIRGTRERPEAVRNPDRFKWKSRTRQLPEAAGAVRLRRADVRRRRAARSGAWNLDHGVRQSAARPVELRAVPSSRSISP